MRLGFKATVKIRIFGVAGLWGGGGAFSGFRVAAGFAVCCFRVFGSLELGVDSLLGEKIGAFILTYTFFFSGGGVPFCFSGRIIPPKKPRFNHFGHEIRLPRVRGSLPHL